MTTQEQIETLRQKIITAFSDVRYPAGKIAPHDCDECREVEADFTGKDWKTIEPGVVEENRGNLSLLSAQAFHYFLPAYLMRALDKFFDAEDLLVEMTIYAVAPTNQWMADSEDYYEERFGRFTTHQMESIFDFLDRVGGNEEYAVFHKQVVDGKRNLLTLRSENYESSSS